MKHITDDDVERYYLGIWNDSAEAVALKSPYGVTFRLNQSEGNLKFGQARRGRRPQQECPARTVLMGNTGGAPMSRLCAMLQEWPPEHSARNGIITPMPPEHNRGQSGP